MLRAKGVRPRTHVGVGTTERELPGFGILEAERLPVKQVRETFGPVALVDALAARLGDEREHLVLKGEQAASANRC